MTKQEQTSVLEPTVSWMSQSPKVKVPSNPVKPKAPLYPAPSDPQGKEKSDLVSRNALTSPAPAPPTTLEEAQSAQEEQEASFMPVSLPVGLPAVRLSTKKVIKLGSFVSLVELDALEQFFPGLTRNAAMRILRTFEIPLIYIGSKGYFNIHTLERVFYYLTLPNRNSFAMPGSAKKNQIFKKRKEKKKQGRAETVDIDLTAAEKEYVRKLERLNTPNLPPINPRGRPRNQKKTVSEGVFVPEPYQRRRKK